MPACGSMPPRAELRHCPDDKRDKASEEQQREEHPYDSEDAPFAAHHAALAHHVLGHSEGRNSRQRQEQGAAQHREQHSPQPHASRSASCEVDAQGEDAEDQADQAEDAAEQVADHVFVGSDEAGPGLELGIWVGLAFEARRRAQSFE